MSTVYEWKITELPEGTYGHIWISESGKDDFGNVYKVFVDPLNRNASIAALPACNITSNWISGIEALEDGQNHWQLDTTWYRRIMWFWRATLNSPRIDRSEPGYEAPWFPWAKAGFTCSEAKRCIGVATNTCLECENLHP